MELNDNFRFIYSRLKLAEEIAGLHRTVSRLKHLHDFFEIGQPIAEQPPLGDARPLNARARSYNRNISKLLSVIDSLKPGERIRTMEMLRKAGIKRGSCGPYILDYRMRPFRKLAGGYPRRLIWSKQQLE